MVYLLPTLSSHSNPAKATAVSPFLAAGMCTLTSVRAEVSVSHSPEMLPRFRATLVGPHSHAVFSYLHAVSQPADTLKAEGLGKEEPTQTYTHIHTRRHTHMGKQGRGASLGEGQVSCLCVSNSVFTERVIFLTLFSKTCFQRPSLCAQDGNDFLMTLRGLVSRQQ